MQPPPDTAAVPAPRRRRRWLLGLLALLVGVPLVCFLCLHFVAQRDLDVVMAELDASDPGWRLDEMIAARKQLPDAENSAVLESKIAGQIGTFEAMMAA